MFCKELTEIQTRKRTNTSANARKASGKTGNSIARATASRSIQPHTLTRVVTGSHRRERGKTVPAPTSRAGHVSYGAVTRRTGSEWTLRRIKKKKCYRVWKELCLARAQRALRGHVISERRERSRMRTAAHSTAPWGPSRVHLCRQNRNLNSKI